MDANLDRFGHFTVHECLGAGRTTIVHRATVDLAMRVQRDVALKRLQAPFDRDPAAIRALVREAKIGVQLDHSSIVKIFELGRIGHRYFISMELVRGISLETLLAHANATGTRVPLDVVLALMIELCDALDRASAAIDDRGEPLRVIVRDVSPANLIVTEHGHLKLIGLGAAVAAAGRFATSSELNGGKAGYVAPEVAIGTTRLDGRADIYSAGAIAWELLTGERFRPDDHTGRWPPGPLGLVVRMALARSRQHRWHTAAAMRDVLDEIRQERRERATSFDVARWARELARPMIPQQRPLERRGSVTRVVAVV